MLNQSSQNDANVVESSAMHAVKPPIVIPAVTLDEEGITGTGRHS